MVLKIIGVILAICGVIWIYDARRITRNFFKGLGDQNEGTFGMKIIGLFFCIVGGLMVYLS